MNSLKSHFVRTVFAFLLLTVGLAATASAATSQFKILLNLDNQINTGCDVPTLTGTFQGAEQILTTTVTTTGPSSAQVTAVQIQSCVNPATDAFGPPAPVTPPPGHPLPWAVGFNNGTGGTSVIETFYPLSLSPVTKPPVIRLGVLGLNNSGLLVDELVKAQPTPGNGPPILLLAALSVPEVPTLSEWGLILLGIVLALAALALLRKRTAAAVVIALLLLGMAGVAWAAACDLNGTTTGEWSPANLLASETTSDAPAGADIRALYGLADAALNGLCFRIDAQLLFNGAPTANDQNVLTNEDVPVGITLTGSDPDGDPLTFSIVTPPAHGSLTGTPPNVTYTPNPNYNGPDSFVFQVDDGNGGTDTGTVTITVNGADDPPTAVNDVASVLEDAPATAIPVLANDTDPDAGPISITSVTQPANGAVVITGGGTGLTYMPNANYCNMPPGTTLDTFTYTLAPGGSTATVTVTVSCVGDTPVANNDTATVTEDAPATAINVLANDTDTEGDPFTIQSVTQPANGVVLITGGGTGLTYQPNANYCNTPPGTTLDTFTYTLTPGGASATVTVTVNCVNDDPVAVDDTATVAEDSGATAVNVLGNDSDPESDPFTIQSVTQPANGTVVITGGGTGLTYQPNANYCNTPPGTTLDTFTYTLTPGGDSATVTMTVTCADDNPVAVNDSATVAEDSSANAINVLANDTDGDGGPISIPSVTQPANGTVVITGGGTGLTYTPNADYCNTPPGTTLDTFTYTLTPGGSSATVTVTVTCADDNPTAVNDSATVSEDSGATAVNVLANDTDADGGPISITSVTQPANGTVVITGGGTGLTYQPNANYCNSVSGTPDTFTYTLTPGGSTATVSVTVTCVDDDPTAVNDSATVTEDSGANAINVLTNDTDPDGGSLSITSVTQPANGTVVITGGGTGLTYAPNANYCNSASGTPDTFTYTLTPGGSTATVSVTVTCVDDPPVAVNDSATVAEDSGANAIGVLANDTDVDGGPLSITSVTQPANGAVVITGGGTGLTYAPNANYC
ncbi:MAG TPA: IPTL-CTERM sorting domain-containing protein, partial [Thermoanaerobaculia bacterium]|nr:IPTL-CTERM sorting domain-containing protein [Thermoanaerobaculia bacterium]